MENLYQTLQDKKKSVKSFKDDTTKGDYYFYFLEEFMPELINNIIDRLKLKDMAKIDSLNDIKRKYTVHFFRRYKTIEPIMTIDDDGEAIYIHLSNGDRVELPKGSTSIDLAQTVGKGVGNNLSGAIVNDEPVNIDYVLNNKDRVYLLTDVMAYGPKQGLEDKAHMQLVKKKIIESKTDWS